MSELRQRATHQRPLQAGGRAFIPRPREGARATTTPLEERRPTPHPWGGIKIVEGRKPRPLPPLLRCPNWHKGGKEGNSLFKTPFIRGEDDIPSFPRGAHVRLVIVRGATFKGPGRGGYLLIRFCL